ncbi:MAG: prenyltransferase/squalene oxidase repeat-containing protein, partial [Chthoniobacteraceae bacterium]
GGDGLIAATDDLTPPPETPADAVPTEQVTPTTPNLNSPNIDVISTTAQTSNFKVAPTQIQVKINTSTDLAKTPGSALKGISTGVPSALSGAMRGRRGDGRRIAMEQNKMKTKSEMAVLKGLRWLQANQNSDGAWGDVNKGAMTGFGLLCFLGHGETPESQEFGLTVNKAVEWILDNGTKNEGRLHMGKSFSQPGVYEHAICTYALGEYYTMTQDGRVKELFKQAIGYIVQGQGPGGGWMYSYDKTADDLSVSGWQIQALKAAHLSKLDIYGVDQALDKAIAYIERVKGPKGGYGYRGPEDRYSLTGVGILCELFWKGERGILRKGMEWMLEETEKNKPVKYKGDSADLYAWYYHTQACLMFGGSAWTKWNRWFQDEICDVQNPDGSWPAPGGKTHGPQHGDNMTGKVYRTSLCILMLEVFYRYMPTTQG